LVVFIILARFFLPYKFPCWPVVVIFCINIAYDVSYPQTLVLLENCGIFLKRVIVVRRTTAVKQANLYYLAAKSGCRKRCG
jgi:hypothetical protein